LPARERAPTQTGPPTPAGRRMAMATPVEVSLWVRAYRSTAGSGRGSGWLPKGAAITWGSARGGGAGGGGGGWGGLRRGAAITWGSSRWGAAVAAAANLAENSPNTRCWLRRSISEKA